MNKIVLWISVGEGDWTAERVVIASDGVITYETLLCKFI